VFSGKQAPPAVKNQYNLLKENRYRIEENMR
jgi:hypothetical protein